MSTLNALRPFVRLCQIIGLIPYTMELDPETKSFQRFSFSFKSFPARWYSMVLVTQIVGLVIGGATMKNYFQSDLYADMHLPIVIVLLQGTTSFTFFLILVIKRGVVLCYRPLRRVVELLVEVDRHLRDLPKCKNTILSRAIIGLVISITLVYTRF